MKVLNSKKEKLCKCAEKLIRDKIIYKKNLKDGAFLYSVHTGEMDANQIERRKTDFENRTTSFLINEGELNKSIELPHDLTLRFKVDYVGPTDFEQIAKRAINEAQNNRRYFYAVVAISKDVVESVAMTKKLSL